MRNSELRNQKKNSCHGYVMVSFFTPEFRVPNSELGTCPCRVARSTRHPVTVEIAGSSPAKGAGRKCGVGSAKFGIKNDEKHVWFLDATLLLLLLYSEFRTPHSELKRVM